MAAKKKPTTLSGLARMISRGFSPDETGRPRLTAEARGLIVSAASVLEPDERNELIREILMIGRRSFKKLGREDAEPLLADLALLADAVLRQGTVGSAAVHKTLGTEAVSTAPKAGEAQGKVGTLPDGTKLKLPPRRV